jgi:hypothetical protein
MAFCARFRKRIVAGKSHRSIQWLECVLELDAPPAPGVCYRKGVWESGPVGRIVWCGDRREYLAYLPDGGPEELEACLDWFTAWFETGWRRSGRPFRAGAQGGEPTGRAGSRPYRPLGEPTSN